MNAVYQVVVNGRRLESRDLRKLLARAVAEKRSGSRGSRFLSTLQGEPLARVSAVREGLCPGDVASF